MKRSVNEILVLASRFLKTSNESLSGRDPIREAVDVALGPLFKISDGKYYTESDSDVNFMIGNIALKIKEFVLNLPKMMIIVSKTGEKSYKMTVSIGDQILFDTIIGSHFFNNPAHLLNSIYIMGGLMEDIYDLVENEVKRNTKFKSFILPRSAREGLIASLAESGLMPSKWEDEIKEAKTKM